MKLLIAIVNSDDSSIVSNQLTKNGFYVTKLSTSGGFLKAGNTTFLIGLEEDRVESALEIIEKYSKKRTQKVPNSISFELDMYSSFPLEVTVGGATVFIIDVERFEKF